MKLYNGKWGKYFVKCFWILLFGAMVVFVSICVNDSYAQDEYERSFHVTMDLNGGTLNGLVGQGWTESSTSQFLWSCSVTEEVAGQGVQMSVSEPYRKGYQFSGWTLNGKPVQAEDGNILIMQDSTLVAQWEEMYYDVKFYDGQSPDVLWSVEVPYGSVLWTSEEPWQQVEESQWIQVNGQTNVWTTTMEQIWIEDQKYFNVEVTRHEICQNQYYYTFSLNQVHYFTYGGKIPAKTGYTFASWKMTSGSHDFTVETSTSFTAQYQVGKSYVIHTYYYYEDGAKTDISTDTQVFGEEDVNDGKIALSVHAPRKTYYTPILEGHEDDNPIESQDQITWEVMLEVGQIFDPNETTNTYSFQIIYHPSMISYQIEYYQQTLEDSSQYIKSNTTHDGTARYGTVLNIPKMDDMWTGFSVAAKSEALVTGGVLLEESFNNQDVEWEQGKLTIRIYYDRQMYNLYVLPNSDEAVPFTTSMIFGTSIPKDYEMTFTKAGYQLDSKNPWSFQKMDENGQLVECEAIPDTMPAYDLYVVANWVPIGTGLHILYWVEERDSSGFQNAYTYDFPKQVKAESELQISLSGSIEISGQYVDGSQIESNLVDMGFEQAVEKQYGHTSYTQFFSYSEEMTRRSPGNIINADATGTGQVTDDEIQADRFSVKVNGDGSTTINVYYTRNMYTLEFVLARKQGENTQISQSTGTGSINTDAWVNLANRNSIVFHDFDSSKVKTETPADEIYGKVKVEKRYTLLSANGDLRSPTGRYGTGIRMYTDGEKETFVYTITAKFEADISEFWPTSKNIQKNWSNQEGYRYVSMGTQKNSYYHQNPAVEEQKNVLNVYGVMDRRIIAYFENQQNEMKDMNQTIATVDRGDGQATHQFVAYWPNSGINTFRYYYLYEVLDTTIVSSRVEAFDLSKAVKGEYQDGVLVRYEGNVYEFSNTYVNQNSTHKKSGQNQPAKNGFRSAGKMATEDNASDKNVYFFYERNVYQLNLYNVNQQYRIPDSLLDYSVSLENGKDTTLREVGWESIDENGSAKIRYGAPLNVIGNDSVMEYLTGLQEGGMSYPIPSVGESQWYFQSWCQNALLSVPVDWEEANRQTMQDNLTLYASWFQPRYPVTYQLNGGTWMDSIPMTLLSETVENQTIFLYYPHQTEDASATLYWYVQTKQTDRTYVKELYETTVGALLEKTDETQHWVLKSGWSIENMKAASPISYRMGNRLIEKYFCYMRSGGDVSDNHERYVTINMEEGSSFLEPEEPVKNGYHFAGWYQFEKENVSDEKVYLETVEIYQAGHVYFDEYDAAHLLHEDENGKLFYYKQQLGHRIIYGNQASITYQPLRLYAAWKGTADTQATIYHLVEKSQADQTVSFSEKGNGAITSDWKEINIGGIEYYILDQEEMKNLQEGTLKQYSSKEFYTDDLGKAWLPVKSKENISLTEETQTVTGSEEVKQEQGHVYRILENDQYHYYLYFVYGKTEEITYTIYSIDLAKAVAQEELDSYQSEFPRDAKIDLSESYILSVDTKRVHLEDTSIIFENASKLSGYTVYENWSQTLQLQKDNDTNYIFFYYVSNASLINYNINYYLMKDGKYSSDYMVRFQNIPGVKGERMDLTNLLKTFRVLTENAYTYSDYQNSANEGQKTLYDRYKNMVITAPGGTFSVEHQGELSKETVLEFCEDYAIDDWIPNNDSAILSTGSNIDVYLRLSEIVIQKEDSDGNGLKHAVFLLERFRPKSDTDLEQEVIEFDGKQYVKDSKVEVSGTQDQIKGKTDETGRVVFQNLSADLEAGYLYRLTEQEAPAGYSGLSEPVYLTVPYQMDADEIFYEVTYTVSNPGITYLPKTGIFLGIYKTMFAGLTLVTGATVAGLFWWTRKRKNEYDREERTKDETKNQ